MRRFGKPLPAWVQQKLDRGSEEALLLWSERLLDAGSLWKRCSPCLGDRWTGDDGSIDGARRLRRCIDAGCRCRRFGPFNSAVAKCCGRKDRGGSNDFGD